MKINVTFQGGQSRYSDKSCYFMLATLPDDELYYEVDVDSTKLLSDGEREAWEASEGDEMFFYETVAFNRAYNILVCAILEQAAERGIDASDLDFDGDLEDEDADPCLCVAES